MALKDSRGGREYDKFVADGSGNTATRVSVTSSVTVTADTSAGAVTVAGATHTSSGAGKTLIAATDVGGKERIGIQMWNLGSGATRDLIISVWGSLKATPGTLPGDGWTQIGDNIDLNAATSAYRAIATTPIKYIAVTAYLDGAGGGPLDTTADCYILAD